MSKLPLSLLSSEDGLRHLPGSAHCTFETLCGACDTTATYTEQCGPPNCFSCLKTAELVFKTITKQQLKEALQLQNERNQ